MGPSQRPGQHLSISQAQSHSRTAAGLIIGQVAAYCIFHHN